MLLLSKVSEGLRDLHRSACVHARAFARREDGALVIFTLYILIGMMLAVGMALDTVRTEHDRILLQNTMDSAILAAADLEQALDAEEVVYDHFSRVGLSRDKVTVTVSENVNEKIVASISSIDVRTMFMNMVGINSLPAPAAGTAEESVTDLEIAVVLDNSGSMGQNSDYRLNLLKPAAKNFIDTILLANTADKKITISIVPFATQVNAGAELLSFYTGVSTEHDYSHCVTFEETDFGSAAMPTTTSLDRTAHFDPLSSSVPLRDDYRVCSTSANRAIAPWSNDATKLKAKIDAMDSEYSGGQYTSIELGAKWATALLDPSSRSVLNAMVDAGHVQEEFRDQPFDYDRHATQKFLVIMSDGENTNQWDIKAPYRSGQSYLYQKVGTSGTRNSHFVLYDEDRVGNRYFRYNDYGGGSWESTPASDPNTVALLSWPEVWKLMGTRKFTDTLAPIALGGTSGTWRDRVVMSVPSSTKNSRTQKICDAAKDKGIIIYTIGMDTYGQGDTTLRECASDNGNFYDVDSPDIDKAFDSIARTITQLRLTQ